MAILVGRIVPHADLARMTTSVSPFSPCGRSGRHAWHNADMDTELHTTLRDMLRRYRLTAIYVFGSRATEIAVNRYRRSMSRNVVWSSVSMSALCHAWRPDLPHGENGDTDVVMRARSAWGTIRPTSMGSLVCGTADAAWRAAVREHGGVQDEGQALEDDDRGSGARGAVRDHGGRGGSCAEVGGRYARYGDH